MDQKILEVVPHMGVPPIEFGMGRHDVESLLGRNERMHPRLWYLYGNALQLDFGEQGDGLEYMELYHATTIPRYRGVLVLEAPADEVVALVSQHAEPTWDDDDVVRDYLSNGVSGG